jgi:hypothetical protein
MKKYLLLIFVICLTANISFAQFKGNSRSGVYGGLGYSFLIYTNSEVSDIYPAFDFRTNSYNTSINPYVGFQISETVALEISPSFIYASSGGSKGFYYSSSVNPTYYYLPSPAMLFAIPLNLKVKLFPFAKASSIVSKGIFFGISGGPMMLREEYDNRIYTDETTDYYINTRNVSNTQWVPNTLLSIGYSSNQQFSYGFEVGYRFVPLPIKRDFPLMTSFASNMNAVVLDLKIGVNF